MARRRCKAKTKARKRCRAAPLRDSDTCLAHSDAKTRESTGFVADNGKQGRPRLPRPHEVMRERIENDIDQVLAPLFDGLEASAGITIRIGDGQDTLVETPDHRTRIAAAKELLDRVYGKARQALEHTGAGGGPVAHEVDIADPESRRLIGELLRRRAAAGQK